MADLVEGKWYNFKVFKIINLPSDSKKYYVLKDQDNKNFLLPQKYYANYGLKPGTQISCRIDKINCVGSYFLEPQHPIYSENKIYDFVIDRIVEENDINNESLQHYFVFDEFQNSIDFFSSVGVMEKKKGDRISCLVRKIRKGKLFLSIPEQTDKSSGLQPGKIYRFKIVKTKLDTEENKSFILEDIYRRKHAIPYLDYKHYGFEIGQSVNCMIRKSQSTEDYVPEPENPEYKVGCEYYFRINEFESIVDYFGKSINIIIVKDVFNNEIKIIGPEQENKRMKIGKYLLCEVTMFKKGKIYLKNMNKILNKQI